MFGIPYVPAPPPDHWLEHEEETLLQGCCLHTPGHTPGSMSFLFEKSCLLRVIRSFKVQSEEPIYGEVTSIRLKHQSGKSFTNLMKQQR